MLAAAGLLSTILASVQLAPDFSASYTAYATQLRGDLLQNYDQVVPPTSIRKVPYSQAGTDVGMQLRFYKVRAVSANEGSASLKVWWRMWWNDTRLSWDPAAYGGIKAVSFNAASFATPGDSEIWLPDATPYNAIHGPMHTFEASLAVAYHDGRVEWSRPGTLEVMCRFSGLIDFPYGTFSCPVEIGGWRNGGSVQGLSAADASVTSRPGCADFDDTEETSLASYQEISFVRVECSEHLYTYSCCPNNPFPVIKYRIFLQRSDTYYTRTTIIPSTLFTLLSFSVFFMSFESGERLGVGVTLVLTIEISRGALQSVLPICGEWLWLEMIFYVNLVFTVVSLLESCVVLGLAYCTEDSLLHPVLAKLVAKLVAGFLSLVRTTSSTVLGTQASSPTSAEASLDDQDSIAGDFLRMQQQRKKEQQTRAQAGAPDAPPREDAATKLIFFESLFFELDVDGSNAITFEEMRRMLSFTALDMTAEERDQALRSADSDRLDGKLSRYEFMDLCTTTLWDQPLDQLKDASACYAEFRDKLKQRANMRWRAQADSIDRNCRFWVPLTYLVVFSVVVSMRLEDHYSGPVGSSAEQQSTTYQDGTQQQVLAASSAGGAVVYRPMSELFGAVSLLGLHPGGYVMIFLFAVALVAWVLLQLTNRSIQREKARKSFEESSTVKDYTERAVRKQATSSSLLASATSTKVLPSMRLRNAAAEQA